MSAPRIAVVTGAASGIGEACARRLHQDGDLVVLADRNLEGARRVATEMGSRAHALFIDLGDESSVQAAAREVSERIGPVQALVNCAGVLQRTLPPEELSIKEWDIVARIDLRGTYLSCVAFGAPMVERPRGAIVHLAPGAGLRPGPLLSVVTATAGLPHPGLGVAVAMGKAGVGV